MPELYCGEVQAEAHIFSIWEVNFYYYYIRCTIERLDPDEENFSFLWVPVSIRMRVLTFQMFWIDHTNWLCMYGETPIDFWNVPIGVHPAGIEPTNLPIMSWALSPFSHGCASEWTRLVEPRIERNSSEIWVFWLAIKLGSWSSKTQSYLSTSPNTISCLAGTMFSAAKA